MDDVTKLEIFKKVEWTGPQGRCSLCDALQINGHTSSCELAAVIRELTRTVLQQRSKT
jgi:hypothetical protein